MAAFSALVAVLAVMANADSRGLPSAAAEGDAGDCWHACGQRGGFCRHCGTGACCRRGWAADPAECAAAAAFLPERQRHECVAVAAPPAVQDLYWKPKEESPEAADEATLLARISPWVWVLMGAHVLVLVPLLLFYFHCGDERSSRSVEGDEEEAIRADDSVAPRSEMQAPLVERKQDAIELCNSFEGEAGQRLFDRAPFEQGAAVTQAQVIASTARAAHAMSRTLVEPGQGSSQAAALP